MTEHKRTNGLAGRPSNNRHGEEPATSRIFVNVMPSQKAAYVKAAGGEKLSAWVKRVLDEAASKS